MCIIGQGSSGALEDNYLFEIMNANSADKELLLTLYLIFCVCSGELMDDQPVYETPPSKYTTERINFRFAPLA